jgi:Fibronectin type III domain
MKFHCCIHFLDDLVTESNDAKIPSDILHVVEATRTSVELEWDQYEPPPEPPATIYRIYKRNSGRTSWIKVTETRECKVKITGLQKDTLYDFCVSSLQDKKEHPLFEVTDVHTKDSGSHF